MVCLCAGMFRKGHEIGKKGGNNESTAGFGCLYQESPGAFMSSAGTSTKNPQLSTSISSSAGGVMRVRRREGF
jgi:hypothetical protein